MRQDLAGLGCSPFAEPGQQEKENLPDLGGIADPPCILCLWLVETGSDGFWDDNLDIGAGEHLVHSVDDISVAHPDREACPAVLGDGYVAFTLE